MRNAVSGAIAASVAMALSGAASAQSTNQYDYNANYGATNTVAPQTYAQSGYQSTGNYATSTPMPAIGGAATSTYAAPAAGTYAQPTTTYAQPSATYAQPSATYAQPAANYSTDSGTAYATPSASYTAPAGMTYTQPSMATTQTTGSQTTPSYAAQNYPTQATTYGGNIYSQPLPTPSYNPPAYTSPVPATTYTPSVSTPTTNYEASDIAPDSDAWSLNLPRYYPAIQACLRRSTAKNPVIANVQQSGQQTVMLIGEGGSSSYSTCKTGLTGTTVKANTETRAIPPVFFAPLASTFTVTPDRPFQPVVDTSQKIIGWMVRTQPMQIPFNQYGQPGAPGFDGQFIPPLTVNTSVGQG